MKRFGLLALLALAFVMALSLAPAGSGLTSAASAQDDHGADTHAADTHGDEADSHAAGGHGDGHGEHAPSPLSGAKEGMASAITALICFGIVVFILYVKVWPMITKGLDERAEKIREEIASAEAARQQAKDALEEYERNLSQARAEANRMLEETKAKQAELAADLRAKADVELGQMRERAMRDIEGAKKAALNEIYDQSVALASSMAGKILAREVTPQDQSRLFEESLAELQSSRG